MLDFLSNVWSGGFKRGWSGIKNRVKQGAGYNRVSNGNVDTGGGLFVQNAYPQVVEKKPYYDPSYSNNQWNELPQNTEPKWKKEKPPPEPEETIAQRNHRMHQDGELKKRKFEEEEADKRRTADERQATRIPYVPGRRGDDILGEHRIITPQQRFDQRQHGLRPFNGF